MTAAPDILSQEEIIRERFRAFTADLNEFGKASVSSAKKIPVETSISGDDNGSMSDLPARVAVLEQIAKDTRDVLKDMREDSKAMRERSERDFRLLFGALITAALGMAGLLAHGFKWL